MISTIWASFPRYVRYPIMAALFLIWTPIKVYDGAKKFIHGEVHAVITPMRQVRDIEMTQIRNDLASIKQDTRDTRQDIKDLMLMNRRDNR